MFQKRYCADRVEDSMKTWDQKITIRFTRVRKRKIKIKHHFSIDSHI